MSAHPDIQQIARKSFAGHRIAAGPARSWRLGQLGRGAYAFRITWAPGVLTVSGDIGSATYEVWPGFASVWSAVEFVHRASFEYFCEKGSIKTEFDRDATVEHLIRYAYDDLRSGYRPGLFKHLCDEYGGDPDSRQDRKEAVRAFRDDQDLTAERVYNITGDFEAPAYSYPARARWTYEAARLWAEMMIAREPRWHRAWRRTQREYRTLRSELRARRLYRPDLYVTPNTFNGNKFWVLRTWDDNGQERARMAAVVPFRPLGFDLSRLGIWREQGSSWPLNGDAPDARFHLLTAPLGTEEVSP